MTACEHHVQRLVEHDLLAALELVDIELGMQCDAHLPAGGEHVHGAVAVGGEERPVRRRWHRELLDLFAQRTDVLARLAKRGGELLVLGDGLGQLALRLEQALLEGANALGSVLQATAQDDDLFLQRLHLLLEFADLALVLSEASLVLGGHADHLPLRSGARRAPYTRVLVVPWHCVTATFTLPWLEKLTKRVSGRTISTKLSTTP